MLKRTSKKSEIIKSYVKMVKYIKGSVYANNKERW